VQLYRSVFYPGQKVVCKRVGRGWGYGCPKKGGTYTVRQVKVYSSGAYGLDLEELGSDVYFFNAEYFEPTQ